MATATRSAEREQFLADIIIGAVEGGTGYWASVASYKWSDEARSIRTAYVAAEQFAQLDLAAACRCRRRPARRAPTRTARRNARTSSSCSSLDIDAVAKGIRAIVSGQVKVRMGLAELIAKADRANDAGDLDAEAADVIAQTALLGEVIYG